VFPEIKIKNRKNSVACTSKPKIRFYKQSKLNMIVEHSALFSLLDYEKEN